ncbi:MAG: sulfotransferase domain-containing protein [Fibrobacterota bacterium]
MIRNILGSVSLLAGFTRMGTVKSLRRKGILKSRGLEDVIVISYPKSGRTWLRVMLDYLDINLRYDHVIPDSKDRNLLNRDEYKKSYRRFSGKRVIFLKRDPRDIVVSNYFQTVKREGAYKGDLSSFIRDEVFGIKAVKDFLYFWPSVKDEFSEYIEVSYEDMLRDTVHSIRDIISFLRLRMVAPSILRRTVELFSFGNMQFFEKKGLFGLRYGNLLRPLGSGDGDSLKVRKGKAGGYLQYMTSDDIRYCESVLNAD